MAKSANGDGTIRKKTVMKNGKPHTYWEGRVTVGYDPATGKQVQKSFTAKTQKEVRQKMTEVKHALDKNTYIAPTKVTLSQWLAEWLETYCKNTIKPLTLAAYQTAVRNHIDPTIGGLHIQDVKGIAIQKLYNELLEKGLSPKTVKNTSAILHKAFSVAVKQGMIPTNPVDAADLPKTKKTEIKPLQDDQIPLFLDAIKDDPYCNAFALCLLAGLREGECLGLSWKQIDFTKGRITVSQQLQKEKKTGGQYYIADSTKSGKPRTIEPPPIAFQYLRAERQRQLRNRLQAGEYWNNPDDLVFTEANGRHIIFQTFHRHFKAIAKTIGCPDARPHDLRHTAATVALASGADIKSVQDLLGHATATFTLDVYAHATDKMKTDTANRVQSYYDQMQKHG